MRIKASPFTYKPIDDDVLDAKGINADVSGVYEVSYTYDQWGQERTVMIGWVRKSTFRRSKWVYATNIYGPWSGYMRTRKLAGEYLRDIHHGIKHFTIAMPR
jgi:hypothetical protein